MRVTINYSTEVEKIPNEIRKLCGEAFIQVGDLPDLEEEWIESLDMKGYERAHEILASARKRLLAIDARFEDCQSLLLDYQKILIAEKTEREEYKRAKQMAFDFPTEEEEVIDE